MFKKIVNWYKTLRDNYKAQCDNKILSNWYEVTWDDEYIYRKVSPLGKERWNDKFLWSDIERICFIAEDYWYSDDICFYINNQLEHYAIPIEAKGGDELWSVILEKNLFNRELATKAIRSVTGTFCWPDLEHENNSPNGC